MANILVTGKHATDHITSAQMGAVQAGMVGDGQYICSGMTATMSNANTLHLENGVAMFNGRAAVIEGSGVDLTITSGMSGRNRNDLVVLRYTKDATSGLEEVQPTVITGTPTTEAATDPTYTEGSILDGLLQVDMPLYRIPVRGIEVPEPVLIAQKVPTLTALEQKAGEVEADVSALDGRFHLESRFGVYTGFYPFTVVTSWWSGNNLRILQASEVRELIGRDLKDSDVVLAYIADNYTGKNYGTYHEKKWKEPYIRCDSSTTAPVRVSGMIITAS